MIVIRDYKYSKSDDFTSDILLSRAVKSELADSLQMAAEFYLRALPV